MGEKRSDINRIADLCADCGNCLHYCPVYNAELTEPNSPRGKVNLIKAISEGTFNPSANLDVFTYQCVLCGSCEYICTKGVEFTDMMIDFRNQRSGGEKIPILKKLVLSVYNFRILKILIKILYMIPVNIQKKIGFLPVFRSKLGGFKKRKSIDTHKKFDILLFPGCMINLFYPELREKIVKFLNEKGYSVIIPSGMKCCGAPYKTQGWNKKFEKLRKSNTQLFSEYNFKYLVVPCGTGVKMFSKYYKFENLEVYELTRFIYKFVKNAEVNGKIVEENEKITYHDPCHNLKSLNIEKEPRLFMKKFNNKFIDDDSKLCCGFGGLFSLNFSKTSKKILKKREERISEIKADTVVTSCPGCYYQLQKSNKYNVKFFIDIFK